MRRLAEHGPCFVCGTENPASMGFVFFMVDDADPWLVVEGTLTRAQQGPPGHAHGGSLAAVLDEAMGRLLWERGHHVVAAHLGIDYRHPTPLAVPLRVEARLLGRRKKSLNTAARLVLPDGTVAVESTGVFVEMGPAFFERFGDFWGTTRPLASP